MKQKSLIRPFVSTCVAALTWLAFTPAMIAHPYATCLTNNSGVISFRLNEAADSVKVKWSGGSSSYNLGPVGSGLTVTNLSVPGVTSPFQVEVTKAGAGVPTLISDNNNTLNQFEFPRGVAVNKRAASPYFGRIYVANARVGTTGTGRPCGDGVYLLNADSTDAVGQGNTALTADINMATGGTSMPWRVKVGADDDMVYLCDWADPDGNLWQADPNMSATSGTNVFPVFGTTRAAPLPGGENHGSISEVHVSGSTASGDLVVYTVDEDYETNPGFFSELNCLWRFNIGPAAFPWSSLPDGLVAKPAVAFNSSQVMGLDRATNGYFYLLDSRSDGNEKCLQVIDPTGPTELWESRTASLSLGYTRDMLSNSVSVAVSPDMKYVAVLRSAGQVVVMPLVNGIPNIGARIEFAAIGTARAIAFDAADNLYVISNSTERMRVYSLGLTTTATTGSNPGGTFSLALPTTDVNVTLLDTDTLSEANLAQVATFNIVRTNDTLGSALPVNLVLSGTATRGADFGLMTNGVIFTGNTITIPAGVSNVVVTMVVTNDTTAELTETATLNLGGGNYNVIVPNSVTVAIVDNESPMADLAVVLPSVYERLTNDYARLRVVRRGDTNAASFNVNLTYTGTAAASRYTAPNSVTIDPGVVNQNFDLTPLNDNLLQGSQTIIANVASGTGYTVGTNSPTATATIVDDEVLPETTLLYSENFNSEVNSNNWTVRFGSTNGIDDYRYLFTYDYASGTMPITAGAFPVLPPAPHSSGDTLGCYLTVNKDEGTALGAAGINLYPNGQSFSGNYAVRFDMYVMVGNGSFTTEYALFGINHSGNNTNWFRNSTGGVPAGWTFDGLFFDVEADGAALGDYAIYSAPTTAGNNPTPLTPGVNASTLTGIFKSPPWQGTSGAGAPANVETSATPSWSDVEIDKVGSLVRLKINNTPIMTVTNNTAFTIGNLMLGYCDAYDSVMTGNSCIIYDNLRVVRLDDLKITNIQNVGANAEVTFTWGIDDPVTVFKLQSSTTVTNGVNTGFADATATITRLSAGVYKATIAKSGAVRFYRIRYAP